jgi:hypothetical protein
MAIDPMGRAARHTCSSQRPRAGLMALWITPMAVAGDPAFLDQIRGLSQQLVHSGSSAADAQIQAYRRMYYLAPSAGANAGLSGYLHGARRRAGLMFLLAFVVRTNDPSAGGAVAAG